MTNIVDRRKTNKSKSADNRKKFIDRYKDQLKKSVNDIGSDKGLKDFFDKDNVKVKRKTISEPTFQHDRDSGKSDTVHPGNRQYQKGDQVKKPSGGNGEGRGGSDDGEGEDEFGFTLTKEEFLDLYFEGMELPNFVKKSVKESLEFKMKRAGYVKEGIPARLDIRKTFEQAMARKIASKERMEEEGRKPRYLDDEDLRYKYYTEEPFPVKHCVMFCVMDVSGSMEEFEKSLSKKFFLLLYLFLHKTYESIELRFIRHHTDAKEVDEHSFFNDRDTGGTVVSRAFDLVNDIIDDQYDLSTTNIYVAQASDGDNFSHDNSRLLECIQDELLHKVQYLAYCEVRNKQYDGYMKVRNGEVTTEVMDVYKQIESEKCAATRVYEEADIYKALKELFTND